jgi:uncharacterized protein (DUF2249 family)
MKKEMSLVLLDVSALEPPEPMAKIIQALAKLKPEECLKIRHRREPFPLYEKLIQTGWEYSTIKQAEYRYIIFIFKSDMKNAVLALNKIENP